VERIGLGSCDVLRHVQQELWSPGSIFAVACTVWGGKPEQGFDFSGIIPNPNEGIYLIVSVRLSHTLRAPDMRVKRGLSV